ncbi:MAG: ATP-dependent Clp protease adapter ClpS [Deltaproteobacteria bacterium]|nr:MAG: ATP-dependent Clp protease adapter ClpS [Deltaproteobacteria bacterium]
MATEPGQHRGTAILEREEARDAKPPRWKVVLLNDDYTTMEFVIHVLKSYFHKSHAEATELMLTVHEQGSAVAGVYSRDIAETKVAQVQAAATAEGHPLRCRAEPE